MFFLGWIVLILVGLGASLVVLFWALRTGQFSDQGRARYLPLKDEFPMSRVEDPAKLTVEVYALLFVIGIGLAALLGTVILTLLRWPG